MYELEKIKLKEYLGNIYNIFEESNAFIAGGAIRSIFCGEDISDIDVYFRNKEDALSFIVEISAISKSVFISDKSYTSYHGGDSNLCIQSIYYDYFESPKQIFDSFDFTCCMGAYDTKDGEFYFGDRFFTDNCKKEIHVNLGTKFPIISLSRIIKYQKRGYKAQPSELIKLGAVCTKINIDTWEDFLSHCGGMYGGIQISEDIKKKDFSIDLALEEISKEPEKREFCKKPSEDTLAAILDLYKMYDNLFCFNEKLKLYVFKTKKHDCIFVDENNLVNKDNGKIDKVILYKKVIKNTNSGRLFSSYNSRFEYIVGEEQVAERKDLGLYFTTWKQILKNGMSKNEVIIECECCASDLIAVNGEVLQFKKCRTLSEVCGKEIENMDISDPF